MAIGHDDVAGLILAVPPTQPATLHHDRPVLLDVLDMVAGWGLASPLVVVFSDATEYLIADVDLGPAVAVLDEDGSNRSSAVSVGLDAITRLLPDVEAALVVDGDVPGIAAPTAAALIAEMGRSEKVAAAPLYRYVRSGPVVVGRRLWDRLMAEDSDQPLHELLSAHPEWTATVVISGRAPTAVS